MNSHADLLRRRLLLKTLASVGGLAASGKSLAAEPAPETNVLRIAQTEDTVRFYALRLHEAGLLKSNAKKVLAEATDFRFLRELKKELKA